MRRPRVLAVLVEEPWPTQTGTGRRNAAIVERLARVADVTAFVAVHAGDQEAAPAEIDVVRVERSRSKGASVAEMLLGVPRGHPLVMGFYRRRPAVTLLREVVRRVDPDVVYVQGIGGAALCVGIVDPVRMVLDISDALHETFRSLASSLRGRERWQWALDAPLLERWFRRNLERYGAFVCVSEHDRDSYRALAPATNLVLVPNGVDPPPEIRPDPGGSTFLFLGDLGYEPNRDGVAWLVREVVPELPEAVQLRIVGRGSGPERRGVTFTGFVPDLQTEWDRAVGAVVPIRAGGGTNLKTLEAFAQGVPVVSTAFGARGLGARAGIEYLQAESPREFADAMRAVVASASRREQLGRAARRLVEERFSWDRCAEPLLQLVAESVARANEPRTNRMG